MVSPVFYILFGLTAACTLLGIVNYIILTNNGIETSVFRLIASLVDLKELADKRKSVALKILYIGYCCALVLMVIMLAVWIFIMIFYL